ncbi:MAG TPA: ankyrin repeat domain-containing protein, partial [Bacteroidetes bacterium]|nr:ankyrin repeat domain-containing protein [Bacteroidota bacterium]
MMLKKIVYTLLLIAIGVVGLHAKTKISERQIVSAIKKGLPATKKLLKKVPIDYINSKDDTLLHYAVRFRKRKVVEYLVNQKILISRKGGLFDGTALQEAIYYGHLGIASYLIEKGSLLNIQNKYGETALHIAAENGYLDIVEELISNGASKSIVDSEGHTPYDLIPNLSWDSRKKLKEVLRVEKPKTPKSKSF